jgi:hypothetical protein
MAYMVVCHNCPDNPHAKGWCMLHASILSPLPRWRQVQVARLLALALIPLLLLLWAGHPAVSLPPAHQRLLLVRRLCRRRRPSGALRPPPAAHWHACVAGRTLAPALLQASLIGLLLWGNHAAPALLLLASLPLRRWLLTLSSLVWPTWAQPAQRWPLHQTLADLHHGEVLSLGLALVHHQILAVGWAAAVVAPRPRPPKPRATGQILDDGTYEVILAEQFAIRHKPIDEFDRRMFLLFLRDIHRLDRPSKWPFVCQVWLAATSAHCKS